MLQWRNWHTRQIQTLFSPGSTPGWSTIFEINSGGDFVNNISAVAIGKLIAAHREGDEQKFKTYVDFIAKAYEEDIMKWNVFSLEAVKEALKPKFVLEKVRYVTDDEEYGEGESTRLVFRNVEEMPEIDYIKRTVCTFIQDTYVHFKDKSLKPMRIWQDNLNESEDHIRYSTNNLVSPPLGLIGETYISDESHTHKWLVAQGGTELLEKASVSIDVDVIYAYDNVDKVEKSSENGEVHGVLINSTMYLRESEIKQVAQLIKDEKLRNRVLTLMRSHRRIVSAPEKENRNIREIASAQMLGQG